LKTLKNKRFLVLRRSGYDPRTGLSFPAQVLKRAASLAVLRRLACRK
jgi:hypothetical protein